MVIRLGGDIEKMRENYAEVRQAGMFHDDYCMPYEYQPVFVCKRRHEPLAKKSMLALCAAGLTKDPEIDSGRREHLLGFGCFGAEPSRTNECSSSGALEESLAA